jgi:hypothetical protein
VITFKTPLKDNAMYWFEPLNLNTQAFTTRRLKTVSRPLNAHSKLSAPTVLTLRKEVYAVCFFFRVSRGSHRISLLPWDYQYTSLLFIMHTLKMTKSKGFTDK